MRKAGRRPRLRCGADAQLRGHDRSMGRLRAEDAAAQAYTQEVRVLLLVHVRREGVTAEYCADS